MPFQVSLIFAAVLLACNPFGGGSLWAQVDSSADEESLNPVLDLNIDYESLSELIDLKEMKRDLTKLASFQSRALGYPGASEAANYVRGRLEGLGYSVTRETFPAVMPIDHGGRLESGDLEESIPLHAFWPNLARPPSTGPEGLKGPLIYARSGKYLHYQG